MSGFVGLKNGGATCYMNAVFQQLYMQPGLPEVHVFPVCCSPSVFTRQHLLCESRPSLTWWIASVFFKAFLSIEDETDQPEESVFYQVQSLFGHLMESKLQYYIPENFWKVTNCTDCLITTVCSNTQPFTFKYCCRSLSIRCSLRT